MEMLTVLIWALAKSLGVCVQVHLYTSNGYTWKEKKEFTCQYSIIFVCAGIITNHYGALWWTETSKQLQARV